MIFSAEWTYLLTTRKVGGEDSVFSYVRIKYGENATDTVTGTIIYPDDFSFSEVGVASMAFGARRIITEINAADWEALENAGCVFLPYAAVLQYTSNNHEVDASNVTRSYYWSATANSASAAFFAHFNIPYGIDPARGTSRVFGMPIRLAQDF